MASGKLWTRINGVWTHIDVPTAKGSLLVATGAGAMAEHLAGNDGEVPLFDSTASDGVVGAVLNEAKRYNDALGVTFDAGTGTPNNSVLSAAATLHCGRIPLLRSISVTNLSCRLSVLGSTLTHSYMVLFKSDGTIVGQTADRSTRWGSAGTLGVDTQPLVGGPFTVAPLAANDFLYAALYVGTASGVLPSFVRGANTDAGLTNFGAAAGRRRAGTVAQADTATLVNIGSPVTSALLFWMGIS